MRVPNVASQNQNQPTGVVGQLTYISRAGGGGLIRFVT